ncbi:helix-turn-helix domain-containing protein [Puteibacter caeruleilacunae]|nr:helix-turn-helix domain-containing protein [Puteibacter caeruleilacunae]
MCLNLAIMNMDVKKVYHPNVVPQSVPFEIITFKNLYQRHQSNDLFDCHRIQFNALFIIFSGQSVHSIDCQKYHMQAGTIIPMVKDQVHHFEKELKVEGVVITFPDEFITDNISERDLFHFLQLYHSPILQIDQNNLSLLQPFIDLLFAEQESENTYLKRDLLTSTFISLVIQLLRLNPFQNIAASSQRFIDFVRFKRLIKEQFAKTHNANDYAAEMGVSYKYLNAICKENSNKTAKAFIDSWLVLEIKRNIAEKKSSVKEIAYNTGFEEPTNMIRFLKKHIGLTPKEYADSLNN